MRLENKEPEVCACCGRKAPLHHNGACDNCVDKWEEYGDEARRIRREYNVAKGREDEHE